MINPFDMTTEAQRQLDERAGIANFRANFDAQMADLKERDRATATTHEYDARFDVKQDLEQQRADKFQQIKDDFTKDKINLTLENQHDKQEFENWVKGSRDAMRLQDNAAPQQSNPANLDLKYQPQQSDHEFPDRERARDVAEGQMRKEFANYQEQKGQNLENRRDENINQIEKSQRNYKQFPWETEETKQDRVAAAEEYAQRQAQEQREKQQQISQGFSR